MHCLRTEDALEAFQTGGIGIVPTDTLWGLSGLPSQVCAQRIQTIKHRTIPKPLILLASDLLSLEGWIGPLTATQEAACAHYWPGPVTLLLPRGPRVHPTITCGFDKVGIRVPDRADLQDLLRQLGTPIISTSANRTTQLAPARYADIGEEILQTVDFIVTWPDGSGTASAILDLTEAVPRWVRGQ